MLETLYKNIHRLQGIRHPVTGYDGLCAARDYIASCLRPWCDSVELEPFTVPGCNKTFHNISARIGSNTGCPPLVLSCHYDTVYNAPGADDNATGVAAVLALAQRLAPYRNRLNLRLLAFSLEESDPVYESLMLERAVELGVRDSVGFYTRLDYANEMKVFKAALDAAVTTTGYGERYRAALAACKDALSPQMRALHEAGAERYVNCDDPLGFGAIGLLGSTYWVEHHRKELTSCFGLINFDSIGYATQKEHSHDMPQQLKSMMETWQVNFERGIGNYIVTIGNTGADCIAKHFFIGAQAEALPYAYLSQPHSYEETARSFPAALQSDHAPFWKAGFPVFFLTDTGAQMRYLFEHTAADTIDKIDFDFLGRIIRAAERAIKALYQVE